MSKVDNRIARGTTFLGKAPAKIRTPFRANFSGTDEERREQRTMATGASVASFYGTSLPRPFLLPVEVQVGAGLSVRNFTNSNSRAFRPELPSHFLLEWAETAAWKQGGVAATKVKKIGLAEEKPKRPSSAYFLFAAEERPKVFEVLKTKHAPAVAKEIGRRWKEISPERKAELEKQAQTLKDEYQDSVKQWKLENEPRPLLSSSKKRISTKKSKKSKTKKSKAKKIKKKKKSIKSKVAAHLLTPGSKQTIQTQEDLLSIDSDADEVKTPMTTAPADPAKIKTPQAPRKKRRAHAKTKQKTSRRSLRMKSMLK